MSIFSIYIHESNELFEIILSDLMGPEIRTNQAWPFEEGSIVELTCLALMQGQDVSLSWDCMNFTTKTQNKVNCSKISSMLVYMASVEDNGRTCRCNAKTEFSILSTSVKLDIRRKHFIIDNLSVLHFMSLSCVCPFFCQI